jgi:hypothetical protein
MAVRIYFVGREPSRPLTLLASAAFTQDGSLGSDSASQFSRELAAAFPRHWRVVPSIEDCDVVVYPHAYEDGPATDSAAQLARVAGKPCLFFGTDENLPPSRLRYGTLYRSSIFERLPHERTIPVFINDPTTEGLVAAATLPKQSKPRVGFCGYVGTFSSRLLYRLAGARQKVDGLAIRAAVLAALRRDPRIECDFVGRTKYLGCANPAASNVDHRMAPIRRAFLENLFRCPYNLAIRGKGNHSVRFYEVLAASRIPLFVNTACVLPLEREIDWKAHTLWVEDSDLPQIGDRVTAGHAAIPAEEFEERQRANRRLWETRLKPEPFFAHALATVASGQPAP